MHVVTFLKQHLAKFWLEKNEVEVYLLLLEKGSLSAIEISRFTGIPKTTIYRNLSKLAEKKLVSEIVGARGRRYEAEPYENLKYLIKEEETKLKSLQDSLPGIYERLSDIIRQDVTKTKIKHYSGVEGLKQVTWNSSKAKGYIENI